MDASPTGAALFHLATDKGHNDPRHNSGEDVQQELLHRHHLQVDSEDCPKRKLAESGIFSKPYRMTIPFLPSGMAPVRSIFTPFGSIMPLEPSS